MKEESLQGMESIQGLDNMSSGQPERAGRREWIGLAVLALPTLILALDMSVLYLAIPHLSADLSPSGVQLLWIMDIYGFMIAGCLITMGMIGDRIGRRKLLMIGAAAFGAASAAAAFSNSAEMLITARAFLGVAGATLMPSTLALISNMFKDPKQRGLAVGVWMSCFSGGMALGPLAGGLLLEYFHWGAVFLLGVPVMIVLLITAPILLPEYRDAGAGRLDLSSVCLYLAAVMPFIYGLKEWAQDGLHGVPMLAMLAGAAFGAAFFVRQRRLDHPLLDLNLLKDRRISVSLGMMLLCTAAMGGIGLMVSQYLQLVEGLSPLRAGIWTLPSMLAVTVGSMLASSIVSRISPGHVVSACLVIIAMGSLMLTQVAGSSGFALLIAGYVVIAIGLGPIGVLATDFIIGSAPPERAGSASAMSETSSELGMALGVAILGSVGAAVYSRQLDVPNTAGIPADAADASRDTIAGAVSAANKLSPDLADRLMAIAHAAFTDALNAIAAISAGLVLIMAVLAFIVLRRVRTIE